MIDKMKKSIARIRCGTDNQVVGVGFLVDLERKILITCAHVVNAAIEKPNNTEEPSETISLDFPFAAREKILAARIIAFKAKTDENEGDIAILQLLDDLPENVQVARLVAAKSHEGNTFSVYGFPQSYERDGQYVEGKLQERVVNNRIQAIGETRFGYFVEKGFSGSPVFDKAHAAVIGMVSQVDTDWEKRVAYLTPIDVIAIVHEELRFEDLRSVSSGEPDVISQKDAGLPAIWNVPHHPNMNFTGRETLLTELHRSLTSEARAALVQAITGLGGVGKTQIAVEYAYRYARQYQLIWWLRAETQEALISDYARLAEELELKTADISSQEVLAHMACRALEHRTHWLLVFDNVPTREDILALIPGSIPGSTTGRILITSRNQDWGGTATPIYVPIPPRGEAVEFLLKRTGQTDEIAAQKLAEKLGDLPLALEQAGAYIEKTHISISEYLDLFTKFARLLLREKPPPEYNQTVATTWKVSMSAVEQKSSTALGILNLCAFLGPEDIPRSILGDFVEQVLVPELPSAEKPTAALEALAALRNYSLVALTGDAVSLHRLVQLVVREELDEESKQKWAAYAVKLLIPEFPQEMDDPLTWSKRARLLPHARVAADHAQLLKVEPEDIASLLTGVGLYLLEREQPVQAKELHERALALVEPNVSGVPASEGPAQRHKKSSEEVQPQGKSSRVSLKLEMPMNKFNPDELVDLVAKLVAVGIEDISIVNMQEGSIIVTLELPGDAAEKLVNLVEQQPELFEQFGSIKVEPTPFSAYSILGLIYNNLGRANARLGNSGLERLNYERSVEMFEKAYGRPDHPSIATPVHNLAVVAWNENDYLQAKALFERARDIIEQEYGLNHTKVGLIVRKLGGVLRDLGDTKAARPHCDRALSIALAAYGPNHPDVSEAYIAIGDLLQKEGDFEGAQHSYEQAISSDENLFGPDHQENVKSLLRLGELLYETNELLRARQYFERVVVIRETVYGVSDSRIIPNLYRLARLLVQVGEFVSAASRFEQCLAISKKASNYDYVSACLKELALLSHSQSDLSSARCYYEEEVDICQAQTDEANIIVGLRDLIDVAIVLGEFDKADEYISRRLALLEQRGEKDQMGIALHNAAVSLLRQKEMLRAESYFQRGLILSRECDDQPSVAWTLQELGRLAEAKDDYAQARRYYEESLSIRETLEDEKGIIVSLGDLTDVAIALGDFTKADQYINRCLALLKQSSEQDQMGIFLHRVAAAFFKQNEKRRAEDHLQRGLTLSREMDDQPSVGRILQEMGRLAEADQDYAQANHYYEESLGIREGLKDEQGIIICLGDLTDVAIALGEFDKADEYIKRRLALLEQRGDKSQMGIFLHRVAAAFFKQNEKRRAEDHLQRGLTLFREADDQLGEGWILQELGSLAEAEQDYAQARRYYEESLSIREALPDEKGIIACLGNLTDVAIALGEFDKADDLISRRLALLEQRGEKEQMAIVLRNVAAAFFNQNERQRAESYIRRAVEVHEQLPDQEEFYTTLYVRAQMFFAMDRFAEAEDDLHHCQELVKVLPNPTLLLNILRLLADIKQTRRRVDGEQEKEYRIQALNMLMSIEGSEPDQIRMIAALERLAREREETEEENHYHQQRIMVSEGHLQRGLILSREAGDQPSEGRILQELGWLAEAEEDYTQARRYYEDSLSIREALKDEKGIIICLGDLTDVAIALGEFAQADEYISRRLALLEQRGEKQQIGTMLHRVAVAFFKQNERQRSESYIRRAVEVKGQLPDREQLYITLFVRAQMLLAMGRFADAAADLHNCQELLKTLPDHEKHEKELLRLLRELQKRSKEIENGGETHSDR
jgi:tetratricopeptide (TPR) repeat protein